MQTFMPYLSISRTAEVLDRERLGKQRLEAKQILDLVEFRAYNNWRHHPAVRMWLGYADALRCYYNVIVEEWAKRGYENNMPLLEVNDNVKVPNWMFDERLTLSHRCNLMRKDPDYYSQFGWKNIDPDAPYWWPVPMKTPAKQKIMIDYWGE